MGLEKLQLFSPKGEQDHQRRNPDRRGLRVSGNRRSQEMVKSQMNSQGEGEKPGMSST